MFNFIYIFLVLDIIGQIFRILFIKDVIESSSGIYSNFKNIYFKLIFEGERI